jgi:hypothetical protein
MATARESAAKSSKVPALSLGRLLGLLEVIARLSIGVCEWLNVSDGIATGLQIQGGCHLKLSRDDVGDATCAQNSVRHLADLLFQQNKA